MGIIFCMLPLMYLIRPLMRPCKGCLSVYKLRKLLKRHLFWGTPYRFMHESYILMVICAAVNFKWLYFDTLWSAFNSIVSILILTAAFAIPFLIGMFLRRYSEFLNHVDFKRRFGAIYD